jgi:hypothetical protein
VIYRRNRTMDIVHKHSSLVHHVPSSESSQAYLSLYLLKIFYGINTNSSDSLQLQSPDFLYSGVIKQIPLLLVGKRTMPIEGPPIVGEDSADFCEQRCVARSVQLVPMGVILGFLERSRYFFLLSSSSVILTRLGGPRSNPTISQKIW